MTRTEAQAIINALVTLREAATDEQAWTAVALYPKWKIGIDYSAGYRVRYGGLLYKCLTAHT